VFLRGPAALFHQTNKGFQMTGYADKRPEGPAKVEQAGPYRNNTAPKAARFGVGASNLAEIKQATEARRAHNEALSNRPTGPRGPIGHDANE
jgi:hypothetical protein